jgi:hypothetical protein
MYLTTDLAQKIRAEGRNALRVLPLITELGRTSAVLGYRILNRRIGGDLEPWMTVLLSVGLMVMQVRSETGREIVSVRCMKCCN